MKKVFMFIVCLAAMIASGTSLKAQEVTITLNPGWTWISYLGSEPQNISTVLGSFTPTVGDMISSQDGGIAIYRADRWRGAFSQFTPGYGYRYYSARTTPVTLIIGGQPSPVVVSIAEPTDITVMSALVGGTVTLNEGNHIFARGLCWSTESNPTIDGSHQTGDNVAGSQSFTLNELTMGATYYVRAYVATDNGLAYSEEITFSTKDGVPVLTTSEVTGIGMNQATCGGEVTDDGGLEITARGICWSTSPEPTVADNYTSEGDGIGGFVSTMTGLTPNTTYYVRAYATNSHTTAYGEEISFTTVPMSFMVTLSANPTECGTVSGGGTYEQGQNCTVIATANEGYTFANWTENDEVVSTSAIYTFTVDASRTLVANFTDSGGGDHAYVDLGLPSGLLWATCNVGAENPEDYGDYFAWGETQPKDIYDWNTYQYCNGSATTMTKYCSNSSYGYNGFTDDLIILLPEDDAATANWGSDWRMPTEEEWQELLDNTTQTWTTRNGVNGRLFTASNGNSIFLPASGYRWDDNIDMVGNTGYYWLSSLYTGGPNIALGFNFDSGGYIIWGSSRETGMVVRGVRSGEPVPSFMIDATSNPAEGGSVMGNGTYEQGQSCTLTATANAGYTFANWTENDEVVSTNATYTFTVDTCRTLVANFDHAYVDLGLPSGLLWATCNIGASSPEDYGNYFAWGETQPKDTYDWNTYQYCNGSATTMTKYCSNSSYGYNGFTDDLIILLPEDDAATANWGSDWRMPTEEEWQELLDNTTQTWTTRNGVNGRLFTASNGNSIFLPASGYRWDDNIDMVGNTGYYWLSSLYTGGPNIALGFNFDSGGYIIWGSSRETGLAVRGVRSASQNNVPTGAINGKFSISDTKQVYFAQGNLQYTKSTQTWSFMEHQYDVLGTNGHNVGDDYANTDIVSYFGWGTSGCNLRGTTTNYCYQPYHTSQASGYDYGPNGVYNLTTGINANGDWGVYNAINNGGNVTNPWRTLSLAEWNYVFSERSDASSKWGWGNIDGVNGVILLPDACVLPSELTFIHFDNNNYQVNTYTLQQWESMQEAGAVFLPAAGWRCGTEISNVSNWVAYWTTTARVEDTAYNIFFNYPNNSYDVHDDSYRHRGLPVRLVRDAE